MSLYAGVNGNARKVKKLLVGVNGSAKDVKTGYAGKNSRARKVYESFNLDTELGKVNPVAALTSGKITSAYLGRTVYLSNSAVTCQEWKIADVNHDGTSGTVDLFPKYTLSDSTMDFGYYQYYANSNVRTYLNGTVLNGFVAEIQNAMKVQNFPSNNTTLSDKVKCPSPTEVGCCSMSGAYGADYCLVEGSIYPIFGVYQRTDNLLADYYKSSSSSIAVDYWTRSRNTNTDSNVWAIIHGGTAGSCYCAASAAYIIACIRF